MLNVASKEKALVIKVLRNSTSLKDTLALFISHQGRSLMYQTIDFKDQTVYHLPLSTQGLPRGVIQLSLMNSNGATLCERFCYVMPSPSLQLTATSTNALYYPFEPIEYHISMKDHTGQPIQGHFSVAVRDALKSDFQRFDQTIYTDLLLTSDLKDTFINLDIISQTILPDEEWH